MTQSRSLHTVTEQDHWVECGQGRLFVRCWQVSQQDLALLPIVLIHDSLGCVELWRGFPAALAAHTGRTVVAYDRLGFGRSDPHPGKLALDFVAQESGGGFEAVLQSLGITGFIVFGHSVGGGMAVHCAVNHGKACAGLISESAQMFVDQRIVQGVEQARELFRQPKQLERLRKFHGDKSDWVLDAWIGNWLNPAFATWSLEPILPALNCPVLAIHGAEDEYGTTRHPEMIRQRAAGSVTVEIIPEARHVPHRERESEIVALVVDFVRQPGRDSARL